MRYLNFIRSFFNFIGTRNWYIGIDKPTLYQRVFKWRLGVITSFKLAKQIWLK